MTDDDPPGPKKPGWQPPPVDPLPPRKSRPMQRPPRASWEPPEPDEAAWEPPTPDQVAPTEVDTGWEPPPAQTVSGTWEPDEPAPAAELPAEPVATEPSVVVEGAPLWDSREPPVAEESSDEPAVEAAPPEVEPTTAIAAATTTTDDPLAPLSPRDTDLRTFANEPVPTKRGRRPPTDDFDEDDDRRGGRRGGWIVALALILVVGLGIGALVLFGSLNKQHYVITCDTDEVVPGQGRGFPPWGTRALGEGAWKPMKIPPEAECRERETEDLDELSSWYLEMLETRASSLLQAREVTKIDEASALLEQALLHARAPERREQRARIERLLGDVQYWRASAKLKDAATALADAAKQFDAAAEQRPRHVTDAAAWATFVRRLADDLQAGPAGATQNVFPPTPPASDRPPAPPGVALPVEPDRGSASEQPVAPPIDAGVPTGGVLL